MKDGNEIKLVEPSSNKVVKIANDNEITLVDNKGKKTKNSGKISIRFLAPTFFEYSGNHNCSKPITCAFINCNPINLIEVTEKSVIKSAGDFAHWVRCIENWFKHIILVYDGISKLIPKKKKKYTYLNDTFRNIHRPQCQQRERQDASKQEEFEIHWDRCWGRKQSSLHCKHPLIYYRVIAVVDSRESLSNLESPLLSNWCLKLISQTDISNWNLKLIS